MAFGQPPNISNPISNPDFYLQILSHVGLEEAEKGSNFVFSPSSIHTVLSMVAVGSRGRTLEQMLRFLRSDSIDGLNSVCSRLVHHVLADGTPNGGPRLSFVGGVWVDRRFPLKPSFKEVVNTVYKAEAKVVDFQAKADEVRKEVNLWAENETNGLIKDLLPLGSLVDSPGSSTILVLANALYFSGSWASRFNPSKTQERDFYLLDGSKLQVPFMASTTEQFLGSFDEFQVLKLPYQQTQDERRFSMFIFLSSERYGLPSLIQKLGSDPTFLDQHLWLTQVPVSKFWLPKFKISFGFKASGILKGLGLELPFLVPGEFTEMVESAESHKLCISEVYHKSFIEVNEEGTEAAAATAVRMVWLCSSSYSSPPAEFVADHPFMFMIREEASGAVLFIGTVINPLLTP